MPVHRRSRRGSTTAAARRSRIRDKCEVAARSLTAGLTTLLLAACTGTPSAGDPHGRPGCRGVERAEVRGPAISYADGPLADGPGSRAMCAAYWLPGAGRGLVPQGLALDGDTAWVGGYRFDPALGTRRCVIERISLRTGERLAGTDTLEGAVGRRPRKYCHHGGGLALTDEGLWVTETVRLWLLDPDLVGTGSDPVRRVWGLVDPLRGSTLVAHDGRLGLGRFDRRGRPSDVQWFDRDRLLAPGVVDLAVRPEAGQAGRQVAPAASSPGALWLQGAATGPDGRGWLARSVTRCGALRLPSGREVAFVPGAEGIELDGDGDLWALSESGSAPYQRSGGRPLVPQLVRLDTDAILRGPRPDCGL